MLDGPILANVHAPLSEWSIHNFLGVFLNEVASKYFLIKTPRVLPTDNNYPPPPISTTQSDISNFSQSTPRHSSTMLGNFSFTIFFCVLLTAGASTTSHVETLPVYKVQAAAATEEGAIKIATQLFGPDDYTSTYSLGRYIVFSYDGTKRVEYDTVSGGIWAADESELWNTENIQEQNLPTDADAIKMADALVKKFNLLPPEEGPVKISKGRISGTFLAHEPGDQHGEYERKEYQLDVSVNYDITLSIPCGSKEEYPIVGGGGKFQVTFGNCGKLIAYQGLWRDIIGENSYDVVPQAEADEEFLATVGYLNNTINFDSTMSYFSKPFGKFQKKMYPVYVYTGTAQVGNETVSIRPAMIQGSRYSEENDTGDSRKSRSLAQRDGQPTPDKQDDGKLEAATEWLGSPYGLQLAEDNAAGFRDEIRASAGWAINYDRSNENVWESDFTTNDDSCLADSVDFMFYTGHANRNGWLANEPGTTTGVRKMVNYASMGTMPGDPGDLLGHQDLEWLVIAACGPHQDESFDPGAGNVFDRWRGIFDGLHIMFAYGTNSDDTRDEGSRLIMYSRQGYSLIDSWFRTAKEAQSSQVIVTAMWTDGPGGNARSDHLPGYGWVSKDNVGRSQGRWFMWTKC